MSQRSTKRPVLSNHDVFVKRWWRVTYHASLWQPASFAVVKLKLVLIHMMTSSSGNIFRVSGPLCGEFTGHRWIPLPKASEAELWCFLWSVPWINGWVNNCETGDLRRHRAHYDVIVMILLYCPWMSWCGHIFSMELIPINVPTVFILLCFVVILWHDFTHIIQRQFTGDCIRGNEETMKGYYKYIMWIQWELIIVGCRYNTLQ